MLGSYSQPSSSLVKAITASHKEHGKDNCSLEGDVPNLAKLLLQILAAMSTESLVITEVMQHPVS